MAHHLRVGCLLAGVLLGWMAPGWGAEEILVRWSETARVVKPLAVAPVLAKSRVQRFSHLDVERITLPPGENAEALVRSLRASGAVVHAEPNYRRRPYLRRAASLNEWPLSAVNLPDLAAGGSPITVALLDDSFDLAHPALVPWFFRNTGEIPDNGMDDDGNGWVDDVQGWDFVGEDADPTPDLEALCPLDDLGSHGTLVAGAAARLLAAYPDLPVRLLPLRIGCGYTVADELAAVDYILANRERFAIRVVNMSYGGPAFSVFEQEAVDRLAQAGILVVTAAGNFEVNNDYIPDYPSSLPNPQVVAVAASGRGDRLTPWSQYGAISVDLAAPGTDFSLPFTGAGTDGVYRGERTVDGTSFASPLVAAALGLLWSQVPDRSPLALKGALLAGVRPLREGRGLLASDGVLDLAGAWQALQTDGTTWVIDAVRFQGEGLFTPALADPGARGEAVLALRRYGAPLPRSARLDDQRLAVRSVGETLQVALTLPETPAFGRRLLTLDDGGLQRHLPLEVGRLSADGQWVEARIRRHDQDDIQRYHLPLDERPGHELVVELEVLEPDGVLDLALARGGYPQLDYYAYCQGGVQDGVKTTYALEGRARLRLARPGTGDHQLLVIAPGAVGPCQSRYQGERRYRLRAYWQAAVAPAGGGCSLSSARPGMVDPVLPALLLLGALGIAWRRG